METKDYLTIENELIAIRNRLPLVSPKMPKKELHHLACLKGALDTAIINLIKLNKSYSHRMKRQEKVC